MDYQVYGQLRSVLLGKCAGSLPFGMRVCALIAAMAEPPSESIFKVFSAADDGGADARAERIRYLQQGAEAATFHGDQLPSRFSKLRASYMKDMTTLLENFARIGRELKSYPLQHRNYHLRSAVTALNEILFNRMLSRGTSLKGHGMMPQDFEGSNGAPGFTHPSEGYRGVFTDPRGAAISPNSRWIWRDASDRRGRSRGAKISACNNGSAGGFIVPRNCCVQPPRTSAT